MKPALVVIVQMRLHPHRSYGNGGRLTTKVRRSSKLPGPASYDAKLSSISIESSVSIIGAVTRFCGFKPNANKEDTLRG